jgi:hypothetical protein
VNEEFKVPDWWTQTRARSNPLIHAFVLAALAAAQMGSGSDSAWAAAMARLKPEGLVRIHQIGGGRIEGRFARGSATTLVLAGAPAPVEYSTATLDSLWVRGTSAKRGAIIGSITLGIAGMGLGVFANAVACESDGGDSCPEAIPILGVLGAAGGGLLGALIGSAIPSWHRRIP